MGRTWSDWCDPLERKSIMKKTLLAVFVVFLHLTGFAKGLAPVATTTATGFNVKFASNGMPLVATQNGSVVAVTGTVNAALGYGKYLPIVAAGAIDGALMRGPWGAAIGALGSIAIIAIPALGDAYIRAGLRVKPDGTLEAIPAETCTVGPCYEYANGFGDYPFKSVSEACANIVSRENTNNPSRSLTLLGTSGNGPQSVCECRQTIGSNPPETVYRFPVSRTYTPGTSTTYAPITTEGAVAKLSAPSPTIAEVQALIDLNFPPEPTMVSLAGPATMPLFNTVQLGTDGSSVTTTETATMSYFPDSVRVARERAQTTTKPPVVTNTVTTNPDGTTSTAVTTTPGSTVTTTQNVSPNPAPDTEVKPAVTCGLPGTPVCAVKVEETGTPPVVAENVYSPKLEAPDTASKSAIAGASSIVAPAWSFSFQLPTGCAPYVTGLRGFIMNVCQFQSTIHDLLSMVWAAATAFGLIGMVGRTIRES